MTEYQFWHGDMRLLESYRKAYIRNIHYISWCNGMYNRIAYEIGARNALASKKGDRNDKWIPFDDPIEKINKSEKPKLTKENLEEEFRKEQIRQQEWLFNT